MSPAIAFSVLLAALALAPSGAAAETLPPSAAICPIVYPLDQYPAADGFRYTFFGNAFFVSEQGYLLTAAHVMKPFRDGGQPHVLVRRRGGARQLLRAELVAVDWEHDVALLRARPNPFDGDYAVAALPVATARPARGSAVVALTLRPSRLLAVHLFEAPLEERTEAEVLGYEYTQLGPARRDTELVLFSGPVLAGQSGAPLLRADTQQVVGVLAGRWLRPGLPYVTGAQPLVRTPGAAIRIHYGIALLREQREWRAAATADDGGAPAPPAAPVPLSLVAPPYPPQTLFGGDVLLDARIDAGGRLAEVHALAGQEPFLHKALEAVRTWTFLPARRDAEPVEGRLGIAFHFPQPRLHSPASPVRTYDSVLAPLADRPALPARTHEPAYPPTSLAEGSAVFYVMVDPQGQATSVHVLHELESLTPAALAAVQRWRFAPARRAGAEEDGAAVVVVTFRRPVLAVPPVRRSAE